MNLGKLSPLKRASTSCRTNRGRRSYCKRWHTVIKWPAANKSQTKAIKYLVLQENSICWFDLKQMWKLWSRDFYRSNLSRRHACFAWKQKTKLTVVSISFHTYILCCHTQINSGWNVLKNNNNSNNKNHQPKTKYASKLLLAKVLS